jgi:hypothetical protein
MIGLGALTAGGSAAFGTEAFTSVEAQRNVDVRVAGDQSAFVAIEKLSSDNARKYVSTEDDDTVQLNFDGDNEGPGGGVSQDAITQVEDLFRVVNQGSQPSSVYFEDSSDAVTFRVTQSTDTSTTGSSGQTLEGADNSVELAVGEQVVIGMTIDTMNHDVSGDLLDNVTLYAEAGASAPEQSIPQPQYVVTPDPTGDSVNEFGNIQSAIDAAETNSVIGIDGAFSSDGDESPLEISSAINVNKEGITLTGFNGKPEIDSTDTNLQDRDGGIVQIEANGISLQNFGLTYVDDPDDGATNGIELASGADVSTATINGVSITNDISTGKVDSNPSINLETGEDLTVTNCVVEGGAIGTNAFRNADAEVTISGNYVDLNPNGDTAPSGPDEGIFAYGGEIDSGDLKIRGNEVVNTSEDEEDIKVVSGKPDTLNGEVKLSSQVESLTEENDVSEVQVNGTYDPAQE